MTDQVIGGIVKGDFMSGECDLSAKRDVPA